MKAIIGLSSLLLVLSAAFGQGWEWQNTLIQGSDLSCVTFSLDGNYGWATSDYGDLLWTTDHGVTWSQRLVQSGVNLQNVLFTDAQHGWAAAFFAPVLIHSTNGGMTWFDLYDPPSGRFMDFTFVNNDDGWALLHDGKIIHTTDGGATWATQDSLGFNAGLLAVSIDDAVHGWAAGPNAVVRTTDGGSTWIEVAQHSPVRGKMKMFVSGRGWALAEGSFPDPSLFARTTDGGTSWVYQTCQEDTIRTVRAFDFADENTGWAVGNYGDVFRTSDGGNTWQRQNSGTQGDLFSIEVISPSEAWVAGTGGLILRSTNGGASWEAQGGNPLTAATVLQMVDFCDTLHGWAGGYDGTVLRTTNGGVSWNEANTGHHIDVRSIAAVDPATAWITGASDTVLRTTDGGDSWTPFVFGHSDYYNWPLMLVVHAGPDHVWVLSDSLHRTTDGGETWTAHRQNSAYPEGMQFTDVDNGWINLCGDEGAGEIIHTSDGGDTWTIQYTSDVDWITSISFINSSVGWATHERDTVMYTANGGADWTPLVTPGMSFVGMVKFADDVNGWIIPGAGLWWGIPGNAFMRTTDGGVTWNDFPSPNSNGHLAMDFVDAEHGWAVGRNGAILRYDATLSSAPKRTSGLPETFTLSAYPNPFNPVTTLSFDLPASSRVKLRVYDLAGRLVETLADRVYPAGEYSVTWNAEGLPSGMYFCRMVSGEFMQTRKLVVLK